MLWSFHITKLPASSNTKFRHSRPRHIVFRPHTIYIVQVKSVQKRNTSQLERWSHTIKVDRPERYPLPNVKVGSDSHVTWPSRARVTAGTTTALRSWLPSRSPASTGQGCAPWEPEGRRGMKYCLQGVGDVLVITAPTSNSCTVINTPS